MYREIKIGDITIPMLANGATALRYKHVFGRDLISEFQQAEKDSVMAINCIPELAFIMAKAAEAKEGKADMNLLNDEMYMSWLEQFGPMDLPLAADAIVNLYTGQSITKSVPKKKEEEIGA